MCKWWMIGLVIVLSLLAEVAGDPDVHVDVTPSQITDMEGLQRVNVSLELYVQESSGTAYDVTLQNAKDICEFRIENMYVGATKTHVTYVENSAVDELKKDRVIYVVETLDISEPKFIILELQASSDVELSTTYEIPLLVSWSGVASSGESEFSKIRRSS